MTDSRNPEKQVTVYELLEFIYKRVSHEPTFSPQHIAMIARQVVEERQVECSPEPST